MASADDVLPRFRAGVVLVETGGTLIVRDTSTSHEFELGADSPASLRDLVRVLAGWRRAPAEPIPQDQRRELLQDLGSLGLLDDGTEPRALRIRQNETMRAESRALEMDALRDCLEFCWQKLPFYRDRMRGVGLEPKDVETPEDYARLPILTKADLRKNFPHNLVVVDEERERRKAAGELFLLASSGTTDERVQAMVDGKIPWIPEQHALLWGLMPAAWHATAVFTTPICSGAECTLGATPLTERYSPLCTQIYTVPDPFGMAERDARTVLAELEEVWPKILIVHPTYAVCLARAARRLGVELYRPRVVLSGYQFVTRPERAELKNGFRAPVFSHYGATEIGGPLAGAECLEGNMHVVPENVFLEVTRGGALAAPGELGSITLTTVRNRVMPLLRYQPGDVGRAAAGVCACPAGGKSATFFLDGRLKDVIAATDGSSITTAQIDALTEGMGSFSFYRFVQASEREYRFELVPRADATDVVEREALVTGAIAILGAGAKVSARDVPSLPQERSMKFRVTQSERSTRTPEL